ncbi:MAG: 1-(5-phosphoribosyl)-5-amino-4-imidazole-carboxylate carboxylase, partial [Deltaproteobacteria bacterium]|nr:1-(5-phosphoribosyl)-5-amino-4-imidazole-carboxylate carboxylase [Deltaproteobacteria bacterium]
MDIESLRALLQSVASGKTSVETATKRLVNLSSEDIEYAHIDHHRSLRKGFPEVIFGQGKSTDQIVGIMEKIMVQENVVLVTRIDPHKGQQVLRRFPDAVFHEDAKMVVWKKHDIPVQGRGIILVVSAGTSDIPVAKEALITAEVMG